MATAGQQFLLHEDASGYGLFKVVQREVIAQDIAVMSAQVDTFNTFKSMVELVGFHRFTTAEEALLQIQELREGRVSSVLEDFLELNLTRSKKKGGAKDAYSLGVWDPELGKNLNEKFPCNTGASVKELLRGCLLHFPDFVKAKVTDAATNLLKAQCGLAHCYSRDQMRLDPNRQDKPIMNAIAILDNLDKNINTFAMRVREWYAWHFPELAKVVADNILYARTARVVRIKEHFDCENPDNIAKLTEACGGSSEVAQEVILALKVSMGQELVEMDMTNIDNFARQVVELARMRTTLQEYLKKKMDVVAPNLSALLGETIGARLISHAGSLTSLAKYPASTVQILGAEKALFRALKTKGNTPKYGLLFHSSFIGRAQQKNKGRTSRYLANKCSLASRIDCFSETSTKAFGEHLKQQCEERLAFLSEGTKPRKNVDVMAQAIKAAKAEIAESGVVTDTKTTTSDGEKSGEKKKSKKRSAEEVSSTPAAVGEATEEPAKKKKKKNKEEGDVTLETKTAAVDASPTVEAAEKKKKKKKEKAA